MSASTRHATSARIVGRVRQAERHAAQRVAGGPEPEAEPEGGAPEDPADKPGKKPV